MQENKTAHPIKLLNLPINYLYLLFFILIGCNISFKEKNIGNKETNGNYFNINVEAFINSPENISLSEIATDIFYLPLETNSSNMINDINHIVLTESYIFISQRNNILQFTSGGNFLRQIGKSGRGPGEYTGVMYFAINEFDGVVLIRDEYKCLKYDLSGKFIEEVIIPSARFLFVNSNKIAFYLTNDNLKPNNLLITDNNFVPLHTFQNHNPRPATHFKFGGSPMYTFKKELCFKENYNDTVFLLKDSILIPHIIYNEKNLLLNKNFDLQSTGNIINLKKQIESVKDKMMTDNIIESNQYILTSYKKGIDPRNPCYVRILFNKETCETFNLNTEKFINNIDGGSNFWPIGIFKDSILFDYITAFNLKNITASSTFKNSTPKYPEKKKELEQLANRLNENDNPVLMLVKLKE